MEDSDTHWDAGRKCLIANAHNFADKVHRRCFTFESIDVEMVQNLKGKCSGWACKACRE